MATPLNILVVEDSQNDADLIVAELQRGGFDPKWKRVETEVDFLAEIKNLPDIILSDYSMPQFSGLRAAKLLQESGLNIPFILISGTVGEDVAVEAMKHGATDYLLKDRIARLGNVVQRALEDKQHREQQKRAGDVLRESERRFREMLENVDLIAMIIDKNGIVTFCNNYLLRLTGWKREEVIGEDWFARFIPETGMALRKLFFDTIELGKIPPHYENPIKTKEGELREIVWNNTMLRDAAGNFIGTASIGEDVTERKRAEAALGESEEKFRQLAENITEVFWITNPAKHRMLYISPAYERIWGRTCASLYQSPQSWLEAIHPEDRQRIRDAAMAQQERGDYDETYRIVRPDGSVRWIHDRGFPVRDATGDIYRIVGTAEDITERKEMEQQFRQSQKMEAIGQLAGGVAHDFNNILMIIQGSLELLLTTQNNLNPESKDYIADIAQAADRAATLNRQLLTFSRSEAIQMRLFDLNDLTADFTKMLRRIVGEHIRIQNDFAPTLRVIKGDPGMIEQVLMNLAVNARDAMPKGGQIIIGTEAVVIDQTRAKFDPRMHPGHFACLSVRDTGTGISPENMSRIFEPFFTTKGVGKGTGLGLATVFGIVEQHKGWVDVSSEAGVGTTFRVFLPLSSDSMADPNLNVAQKVRGGAEKVLLVEDEEGVRDVLRQTLEHYGYAVVEAASGIAAQKVWAKQGGQIDLLITDMVMPGGLTGLELIDRLRAQKPGLKVMLMSGYSAELMRGDITHGQGITLLHKPFASRVLAEAVRKCLDAD